MLALLLAVTIVGPAMPSCFVEQAHYQLRANPSVTAEFHPTARNRDWSSGLTLAIHMAKTGRTYWWLPWNGGTDDMRHVRLTWNPAKQEGPPGELRPGLDLNFWTTDGNYNFLPAVPKAGDRAPGHFLLPTLGRTLYYGTVQTHRSDDLPRSFFDLVSCGPANRPADVVLPPVA